MVCNNGNMSQESVIEVIHLNMLVDSLSASMKRLESFTLVCFRSVSLFMIVCVQLALKVMRVWTHQAFMHCMICGLLSQKGFKFTWMHSVTWDPRDPKSRKISVFPGKPAKNRSLLLSVHCLTRLASIHKSFSFMLNGFISLIINTPGKQHTMPHPPRKHVQYQLSVTCLSLTAV